MDKTTPSGNIFFGVMTAGSSAQYLVRYDPRMDAQPFLPHFAPWTCIAALLGAVHACLSPPSHDLLESIVGASTWKMPSLISLS